ncbi:hypothetical protein INR49_007253 [Caranx melampygus]|nr:hypothetical protein INR49_007253 [Caranx melampygus]
MTSQRWLAAADLQQEVYSHLAAYVPRILCLVRRRQQQQQGGAERGAAGEQREELACQLLLLAPLEWLLLGEEPAAGLAQLQENNQPSPLCGHVFRVGEPTYSCSVHKEHRYRMTTSGGGGFCDCGDAEAWKKGPYCQKHTPQTAAETPRRERGDTYYCMLFNDEVHTYEQVIYTLQKAVNCSQREAVSFATTVDRDRNTSRQSKPLRVQVMHSSVVAHQCFALKALSWLGQILQYSDGLRRILCQVGLQRGPEGENSSLVDR